jgi:nicotinamidase/pyrazinamidase
LASTAGTGGVTVAAGVASANCVSFEVRRDDFQFGRRPMTERPVTIEHNTDVLLVTDIQHDFMPGGALAVNEGDAVIAVINRLLAECFAHAVATQDWHPKDHASFASQHPGSRVFDTIQLPYGEQTLWPDHCVQGSGGAQLRGDLDQSKIEMVIRKGFRREVDSYSAFRENDRVTTTGLDGYLRARGFRRLFIVGLARGYCTDYSAEDAAAAGYETFLVEDACRGIDARVTEASSACLRARGVHFIRAGDVRG